MKAKTIKQQLTAYLQQAIILHQKGNQMYYNTMARLNAIERVKRCHQQCQGTSTPNAASLILRHQNDLFAIMPVSTNRTHAATLQNINNLLQSCRQLTKTPLEV